MISSSSLQAQRRLAVSLTIRHLDTRMVRYEGTVPVRVIGPTIVTAPLDRTVPLVQLEARRPEKGVVPRLAGATVTFLAGLPAVAPGAAIVVVAATDIDTERGRERHRAGAATVAGAGPAALSVGAHLDVAQCAASALRAMARLAEIGTTATTDDRRVGTLTVTET